MKNKMQITIKVLRWTARISSILLISFFMFFFIADLFEAIGRTTSEPMKSKDIINLSLMGIMFIGLLLAWKKEFAGGLITVLSFIVNASINHQIIFWVMLIYPLTGMLFMIVWWLNNRLEKTNKPLTHILPIFLFLSIFLSLNGCQIVPDSGFGSVKSDKKAGRNLGFEVTKENVPVNWYFYSKYSVNGHTKNGNDFVDFDYYVDKDDYKEGKQSIKCVVRKLDKERRVYPGIFKEYFDTESGGKYKISFWLKNTGSDYMIIVNGVSAKGGEKGIVIKSKETINSWKYFEYTYTIPTGMWLRFEAKVLSPGSFWLDGIQFEKQ